MQHEDRFLRKTDGREAIIFAVQAQEMFGQGNDVRPAFAKGRHGNPDDVQAVEQVLAEKPLTNGDIQVSIGRGQNAKVPADGLGAP